MKVPTAAAWSERGRIQQMSAARPPVELTLWKPNADDVFGITFEVPADDEYKSKGCVVAAITRAATSKKLKLGDVVHIINGRDVTKPKEAATLLREAKGVIQVVITRADARPGGQPASDGDEMRTRSMPVSLPGGTKRISSPRRAAASAGDADPEGGTTVVVSCSQLIKESKKIVGKSAGLDESLDTLYASLKAREIASQDALTRLVELVGQTTVELAGLAIANTQKGALADGWVEYLDKESKKAYYYNVHTKATTWTKPVRSRPPPPPPPSKRKASEEEEVEEEEEEDDDDAEARRQAKAGPVAHQVADAIANRAAKKRRTTAGDIHRGCDTLQSTRL